MADLKCEILEGLVELPDQKGYHLELNLIKWGDNPPKYDLRRWTEGRAKMAKGVTMTREELLILRDGLSKINL